MIYDLFQAGAVLLDVRENNASNLIDIMLTELGLKCSQHGFDANVLREVRRDILGPGGYSTLRARIPWAESIHGCGFDIVLSHSEYLDPESPGGLVFVRLRDSVNFNAPDGTPTRFVALCVMPSPDNVNVEAHPPMDIALTLASLLSEVR
jgi:hypothetical protein